MLIERRRGGGSRARRVSNMFSARFFSPGDIAGQVLVGFVQVLLCFICSFIMPFKEGFSLLHLVLLFRFVVFYLFFNAF